ncbi:MAG: D-inositol-3-phosphate glycosyltransferase [Methanocella sp. PtaU1.Bin125]|nr:MAG: D-inositol-3-phosphate glycosyltransferase [Methanocella sp. PtaU1.Bin125]
MKVAIFHDYIRFIGGGEKTVLTLARALGADVITTDVDRDAVAKMGFGDVRIVSLGGTVKAPPFTQLHASRKFRSCDFSRQYDRFVMSGNWAVFACRKHRPNLWYCYTPVRAFFDRYDHMRNGLGLAGRLYGPYVSLHKRRYLDAVKDAETVIAISEVVRERVKRYLGREAAIIYPPVDVEGFSYIEDGGFWLSVNRLYPEKRVELQVEAFRQMPGERLVIIGGYGKGDHSERYARRIMRSLPPNVSIVSNVDDATLKDYYGRCRGLVATSADEDFGLNAAEAMAAGKPVIAVREGGYLETVVPGVTGTLIDPDPGALARAVRGMSTGWTWSREACERRGRDFDGRMFERRMKEAIEGAGRGDA